MKKILFLLLLISVIGLQQLNAQVTTNSGSGLSPTYPSLDAAITALNGAAITSPVIIQLTGNETAPVGGYVITAEGSAANTITIQGSSSTITANAGLVVGSLNDGIFKLQGADYVTIQNFTMQENVLNVVTVPATNTMTEWAVALLYASTTNGSQNNTIQNNTISLNRLYGNTFGVYSNVRHSPTAVTTLADITNNTTAPNNNNKVYSNTISNVSQGFVFIGSLTGANENFGNDIGGSSLATGNNLTNYGGVAATTAYVGYSTTIYCGAFLSNENSYNFSYNSLITASLATAVAFRGIIVTYDAVPVGTITNNVNNNTVTVTNSSTGGLQGITGAGLAGLASVTLNMNSNRFINSTYSGGLAVTMFGIASLGTYGVLNMDGNQVYGNVSNATTGGFIGMTNQGIVGTLNVTNNEIGLEGTNAITMSAVTTAGITGFSNTTANTVSNISGNYFRNFSLVGSGQLAAIINSGAFTSQMNILHNHIGTAASPFATYSAATAGNFFGVVNAAGNLAGTLTIRGNDIRGLTNAVTGSGGHNYYNNQVFTGSVTMDSNTISNAVSNTTGGTVLFSNSVAHAAGTTHNINYNSIVGTFNRPSLSGAMTFYNAFGTSPATVTENNIGNNISNVTFAGASTSFGWRSSDGTTPGSRKTVTNNTFNNITGGTGAITSILQVGTSDNTFNGNNVSGNTISNITSGGNITCIASIDGSQNFFQNTITNITSTGSAAVVNGMNFTGGTVQNIYRNKISNLTSNGATATVNGITIAAGSTMNVNNNFIGPFNAPSTSSTSDAIRGINITSATTLSNINLIYNTIYINATSAGADFSTSGVFHTTNATASTADLTMINNIIYNTSTPNGTGVTSAYRRSSADLTNYNAASNYNDLYVGTPAANILLFWDGTSGDQTIGAYQTRVAPRDANSISREVFFADAGNGDFHVAGTSIEDILLAGLFLPAITYDYDGETRHDPPYMGADENTAFPLPVELASFTSTTDRNKVELNWSTIMENNNSGFDIERKLLSDNNWIKVGNVAGKGNSNVTVNYTFKDNNVAAGKYNYRLKQIDYNGNFEYFNLTSEVIVGVPSKFALSQNYPNPFNPATKINYDLPFDSKVAIKIFDITGREVVSLVNQVQTAGYHTVNFNASNLSSGAYFYTITAEGGNQSFAKTLKMMLVK
jgi:hypothetical protein